ncbi:MAG: marine proteobacterial sortase target protein [Nitrospira sp.]|jgi:Ca-activated chloride channel family protein|nr:marine proteobacterial sortase target protein [Nitrospira sp.]
MTKHLFLRTTLALFLSVGTGTLLLLPAFGNEPEQTGHTISVNDVKGGRLLFKTAQPGRFLPAPTLTTDVRLSVTGLIARATVTQEFLNPSLEADVWAEGVYVFPLPETAAVDHLRMKIGERIIEGQIKEKSDAKKVYEQAKQAGKRASLVEQERPNIFTTSVANIGPGERISVEIEYQETIRYDQGAFSLRFPMVVGPRYIPGTPVVLEDQTPGLGWSLDTDRVPDASRITPPVQHPASGSINPVSLTIDLAPGFPLGPIESPSHAILTIAEPDGRRHITLRADTVPADRDFVLTWKPAPGQAPTLSVFREQRGDNHYAFLMAMPPVGHNQPASSVPRETIFVIDTSGSMSGTSIEQAKAALLLALHRLTAQDRFNVIQFNSVTHVLFSQAQPVTPQTLRKAVHYVEHLTANGGTEILPALKMALKGSAPASHLRQVVFLTDGQVGNEDELFEIIRTQLGPSRLFTIGIGSAPNSHFMRKAAEFGRGTFTHIGSTNEVQAQMDAIFRKLERPALTDLHIEGLDGQVEMFPPRIPDLYEGEPVVVVLKGTSLPETVTIRGMIGSAPWTTSIPLKDHEAREGLSVYWARQKIAALMDQQRYGQDETATRQAVLNVALAHHLVSPYTSLVAVDVTPVRPANQPLHPHAMKTNLPDGQHAQAIFGLPQTATSGPIQIALGLAALLAAWMAYALRVRVA